MYYYNLTLRSNNPIQLNYSDIHDELSNFNPVVYPELNNVLSLFKLLIEEVYQLTYSENEILGWVTGLHKMFAIAEGNHPKIYKKIPFINEFLFEDYQDLINQSEQLITLTVPIDRTENFLKAPKINYFDDCIPRFYKTFIPVAQKAYNFIYNGVEMLTIGDLPLIDLDTGRDLASITLNDIPVLWS